MKAGLDFFEILSQSIQEVPFSVSGVSDLQFAFEYCFLLSFGGQVARRSIVGSNAFQNTYLCDILLLS